MLSASGLKQTSVRQGLGVFFKDREKGTRRIGIGLSVSVNGHFAPTATARDWRLS